jgi:hypothetical protein
MEFEIVTEASLRAITFYSTVLLSYGLNALGNTFRFNFERNLNIQPLEFSRTEEKIELIEPK